MKSVYLYNRRVKNGEELKRQLGADRIFDDYKGTNYADLELMLTLQGDGDIVAVYDLKDFGGGSRPARIQRQIEALGATVEIIEEGGPPKAQGRPHRSEITLQKFDEICLLWYSPADQSRVEEKTGMNRGQLYYLCGARDGSDKKEKRLIVERRMKNKEQ